MTMTRSLISALTATLFLAGVTQAADALTVTQTVRYPLDKAALTFVAGQVRLPADGHWQLTPESRRDAPLRGLALVPGPDAQAALQQAFAAEQRGNTAAAAATGEVSYVLIGLLADAPPAAFTVSLSNRKTGKLLACTWTPTPSEAREPDEEALRAWAQGDVATWVRGLNAADTPVLLGWLAARQQQFDVKAEHLLRDFARRHEREERTFDAFSLLGGRAAIEETLQLQELRQNRGQAAAGAAPIPIAQIPGVEVKSHPFEQMLQGQPGGRLPLADAVPPDRFFACFTKPAALTAFLDSGSDFLYRAGALATGNSLDYDLKNRYLGRLGMNTAWLTAVLNSGAVAESAVFLPDLFLADGTEVTVVARLPQMALFRPLLAGLGISGLKDGAAQPVKTPAGGEAYWATAGDLLLVSTSRDEITAALGLHQAKGAGSLGQSPEFRYMLTQLPLVASTRAYAYLSDPFIRRLVSPAVKIPQLRRLLVQSELEMLSAGALLYRLDHGRDPKDVAALEAGGYLPEIGAFADYQLQPGLRALSPAWGTCGDLRPLLRQPAAGATLAEAEAYKQYLDNYRNYWRQYFDPIALRLDDAPGGALELTTFILPLLESRVYNQLRESLAAKGDGTGLNVPQLQPRPVAMLSFRLGEKIRQEWQRDMGRAGPDMPLAPGLLQQFAGVVHLAIQDGDPIIAFGSSDLLGAFGSGMGQFGRGSEMLVVPVLLSVFTRPCALLFDLHDGRKAAEILARGPLFHMAERGFRISATRAQDREAWIYTISLFGSINIRLGVEILGNYLVVTNLPWSQELKLAGVSVAPCTTAALQVNPGAIDKQLRALWLNAAEQQRDAALAGIAYLTPLVSALGCQSAEAAAREHLRLFGFTPQHPGTGKWVLEKGELRSTLYGTLNDTRLPAFSRDQAVSTLFSQVPEIGLSMQFEDTGLRSVCRWKLAPPPKPGPATP